MGLDPSERLHELYRLTERNLELRRRFLGLGPRELAALRRVARWADGAADGVARDLYEHQLAHPSTRAFLEDYGGFRSLSAEKLRARFEPEHAAYVRRIFAEAADGDFGVEYVEERLRHGQSQNVAGLPLKWVLGAYAVLHELMRARVRRRFAHRPLLRRRVERALTLVLNYDLQAAVDAVQFDTFATMGVALDAIEVSDPDNDLSDHGRELKRIVRETLAAVTKVSALLRTTSGQMAAALAEAGRAVAEIDDAVGYEAAGAERQHSVVEDARRSSAETAAAAGEARDVALEGVEAAQVATAAMEAAREAAAAATGAIEQLEGRSATIGGIVETMSRIAGQTNLLALNAAIEAARAGEQGRGFAVVAEEVRKLAEESEQAAASIGGIVAEIQRETAHAVEVVEQGARRTEDGAATVERTREAFLHIGGRVADVSARAVHIDEAIAEVAAVAAQSSSSRDRVSAATEQSGAATQQLAAAAAELAASAEELERLLGRFAAGVRRR